MADSDKCSFTNFFGGEFFEEGGSDCPILNMSNELRIFKKFYSLLILLVFFSIQYYYRRKHGPFYFESLMDNSIFSIFSAPDRSSIFETSDSSLKMFQYRAPVYRTTYIIDFFSCFCLFFNKKCLENIVTPMRKYMEEIVNKGSEFLLSNIQYGSFYLVLITWVVIIPFEHILSFMISPCLVNYLQYPYIIIDAFMASFALFVCVFIFSFVATRREILSIDPKDTITRQAYLLYHLRKSIVFACCLFVIKFIVLILSKSSILEVSEEPETSLYWIGKNAFLLVLFKRNSANIIQIRNDCCYLKEESRFYLIEGFLKKNTLKPHLTLMRLLKNAQKKVSMDWVKEKLDEVNALNFARLQEEIKINDKQVFKNLLRKGKSYSYYPSWLMYYVFFDCSTSIILSLLSILVFHFQAFPERWCGLANLIIYGFMLLDILESTLFPYLIYQVTKKTSIFGEEKIKSEIAKQPVKFWRDNNEQFINLEFKNSRISEFEMP